MIRAAGTGGSSGGGAYNVYPTVIAVGTESVTPSAATKYGNTGSSSMNGDSVRAGSGGGTGGVGIVADTADLARYGGPGLKAFIATVGSYSSETLTQEFLTASSAGVIELSDSSKRYIGGGGGGDGTYNQAGGLGGGSGGSGSLRDTGLVANTGSGGHGRAYNSGYTPPTHSGSGATGIVIIRYAI